LNLSLKLRYVLFLAPLILGLMSVYLFIFARSSFAYKAAVPVLFSSREIQAYLGEAPDKSLLVGIRQFLSIRSCAEITFYVRGAERGGFVELRLVQEPGQPWRVYEVVPGWFTKPTRSCQSPGDNKAHVP
jgi:hypothetical protein